jgi:membrane protease YdiL (CAAX protease family)
VSGVTGREEGLDDRLPLAEVAVASGKRPVSRARWWIHLILIGGYFLPFALLGRFRRDPALTDSMRGLLFVSIGELIIFSAVFGLGWFASRASREQMLLAWRPGWSVVPLGIAYSIAIRVCVAIVAIALSLVLLTVFNQHELQQFWEAGRPKIETMVSVSAMRTNPVYVWLLATVVSFVVAGLREEMWRSGTLAAMRALWPKIFSSNNGEIAAVALIAIAFGAGHAQMGLVAVGMTTLLGLFLGLIMVFHRSIWPAVIAHGCFDAASFAFLAWLLRHSYDLG